MAKKKSTGININLLKGITGSKLAGLIALLVVIAAIPLTVLMSQKQQQTQQEAAVSKCVARQGTCINTDYMNYVNRCRAKNYRIVKGLCPGKASIQCCLPPVRNKCEAREGICKDWTECPGGNYQTGLCPGGKTNVCCLYWKSYKYE